VASGAIAAADVVTLTAAGAVTKAQSDSYGNCKGTIGFSNEAIVDTETGTIIVNGVVTKAGWGLTAGALYYLDDDTAGGITATYSDLDVGDFVVVVGKALSATELLVDIDIVSQK